MAWSKKFKMDTLSKIKDLLGKEISNLSLGLEALAKLIDEYEFSTVLDIGATPGHHTKILRHYGKQVTALDWVAESQTKIRTLDTFDLDVNGDYNIHNFANKFDAIWCSHVLEHQVNSQLFLKKIHHDLEENGVLAITVPPLKHEIVGGHVTLWNGGLLLYNLILAGFDCSEARLKCYDYNISVIVRKKSFELPKLYFGRGDIEKLSSYFPFDAKQGFNGNIQSINWDT